MNEHLDWLEKNKLLATAKSAIPSLKKIFKECLAAEKEQIIIVGDRGFEDERIAAVLSGGYYLAAKEMELSAQLVIQEPKFRGDKADENLINTLSNLPPENIIVLCLTSKLGNIQDLGKSFRTYAKEHRHRFISTPSLGNITTDKFPFLLDAINIDYAKLREKGIKLKEKLDAAEEVHITTKAGTDLLINIKGKTSLANTGNYKTPGKGGNIPAGEVYTPPKWKHVDGTVVVDGSSACREGTVLIKDPITLTIKKDEIIDIQGGKEAKQLETTLRWASQKAKHPWGIRRIGELGIGINDQTRIIGSTLIDEKTLGTAHVAIGSNHWFGGTIYAIIHLDQVFKDPKIELDGELLNI